ncbi:hypothetical protein K402DRAFT_424413 [Aulographum hederae CBS 113979]|uniref:FHA domain-containing protein n=1 Tax=Aulographum hederae CBS 113979 TaxID=1176131 RepID=A0A6G1GPI6_9PEZI|nr:hypothetical protein K402DRAFT_424413 [Aulographum hederae CBS 113979]
MSHTFHVTLKPFPGTTDLERALNVSEYSPIQIGRASKTQSKHLSPSVDNAWIDNPVISRSHAEITSTGSSVFICDKGSMHGTLLDGVPLQKNKKELVEDTAVVTFGTTVVRGNETFYAPKYQVRIRAPHLENVGRTYADQHSGSISGDEIEEDEEASSDMESVTEYPFSNIPAVMSRARPGSQANPLVMDMDSPNSENEENHPPMERFPRPSHDSAISHSDVESYAASGTSEVSDKDVSLEELEEVDFSAESSDDDHEFDDVMETDPQDQDAHDVEIAASFSPEVGAINEDRKNDSPEPEIKNLKSFWESLHDPKAQSAQVTEETRGMTLREILNQDEPIDGEVPKSKAGGLTDLRRDRILHEPAETTPWSVPAFSSELNWETACFNPSKYKQGPFAFGDLSHDASFVADTYPGQPEEPKAATLDPHAAYLPRPSFMLSKKPNQSDKPSAAGDMETLFADIPKADTQSRQKVVSMLEELASHAQLSSVSAGRGTKRKATEISGGAEDEMSGALSSDKITTKHLLDLKTLSQERPTKRSKIQHATSALKYTAKATGVLATIAATVVLGLAAIPEGALA